VTDQRVDPSWRHGRQRLDWLTAPGVYWEDWSMNGEVCITGLVPPAAGGASLAHCLTGLLRELASRCRRTHDSTGVLLFTCTGPRTPTPLAGVLALCFDLMLRDPGLIRAHLRRRLRREPAPGRWPALWLEGTTQEYPLRGVPFPTGRPAHRKLVLLAEERQVLVPARPVKLAGRIRRAWARGLEVLGGVDAAALPRLLDEGEQGFLASMLVLVHTQPAAKILPRPSLEASYRRHETLVAGLAGLGQDARWPVTWHAVWRLPPGMSWGEPGHERWLRYPAVSFVVAARPFAPTSPGGGPEAATDAGETVG
jgi:hypothetical protein